MALTVDNKKQLLTYITKARAKGYNDAKIIAALEKVGYADEDIATLPVIFPKRFDLHRIYAERKWLLLMGCVGLIILLTLTFILVKQSCSDPLECFLQDANACKPAVYETPYGTSTLTVESTSECTLEKYFSSISLNEPFAVQTLLADKRMSCAYEKNSLTATTVMQLTANLENCQGELVDVILTLQK